MIDYDRDQWLYWNDVERCPFATWSTSNAEERRKGRSWGMDDDKRMHLLSLSRFGDWLIHVRYYGD
jgi:hypothetical protein